MPFKLYPFGCNLVLFFLAVNAGIINVFGLVTVLHQSVSHMTGNVSILAMALIDWKPEAMILLFLVMFVLCDWLIL